MVASAAHRKKMKQKRGENASQERGKEENLFQRLATRYEIGACQKMGKKKKTEGKGGSRNEIGAPGTSCSSAIRPCSVQKGMGGSHAHMAKKKVSRLEKLEGSGAWAGR